MLIIQHSHTSILIFTITGGNFEKASIYGTTLKTAVDYVNAQTNSIIGLLYIAGDENQQLKGAD